MVKKIVFFLSLMVFLLVGAISYILYSRTFLFFVVKKLIETNVPETKVGSFDYQERHLRIPDQLTLGGVKLILERKDQKEEYRWQKLSLTNLFGLFGDPRKIRIIFEGLEADSPPLSAHKLNLNLNIELLKNKTAVMTGQLDADSVGFDQYTLNKVTSFIRGDERQIQFNTVTGEGYRGKVQGQILVEYAPRFAYSIQLEVLGIDLASLQSANPALFSQVDGKLNGQARIKGDLNIVSGLETDFDIPSGGTIKASWLKFVIDYIPPSMQKRDLELLIKNDGSVPVEKATFHMRSLDMEKLTSLVTLKSAKLNLDINLTVDLNIDGGLKELFNYGITFSK